MSNELSQQTAVTAFSLIPTNLKDAMELAKLMADSELVPKDYRGKPGNVLVAVQMGLEVGLKPMQAVQGIAVINGRPSLWGDAMWALIKGHPLCESTDETFNETLMTATCIIRRRGAEPVVRTFSKSDAEKAGLWNKDGPWKHYPKRMLQMRARAFAARDSIPEALKGFGVVEEQQDRPAEKDMGNIEREIEFESSLRACSSIEDLRATYEAMPQEEQLKYAPLVAEMKKRLKQAAASSNEGAKPEATVIDCIAKLEAFDDLDKMGDYATALSDEIRNDERFAKAFAARMKAIREAGK